MENYFKVLNGIDVSEKTEEKNKLTYLSWAWAWAEVKKVFPDTVYKIYERETEYGLVNYFTDGKTAWVKTGVTINGIEHIEFLPVMNYRNQSITLEDITSTDVNKAIQRSLTKAVARHGLGLYIYAGEDLPEQSQEEQDNKRKQAEENKKHQKMIVSMFNDLVKEHGTADKVYEVLKTTRDKYIALYNDNPKELWEFMQSNA